MTPSTEATSTPPASGHTVPAGVLFPLLEVAKHWGVSSDEVLGPFGLREQDVVDPQSRFTHEMYLAIIGRARAVTAEPGIGFCWGLQMRLSTFGYLGFATMSVANLRAAIDLAIQFAALGSTAEGLRLHVDGDMASLVLEEYADFGDVRDVVTAARLIGLWRIAETVTGRPLNATAEVALPEPSYYARFAHLVPSLRFGQPVTRAILRAEALEYPLVMANPVALQLARAHCEAELLELRSMSSGGRLVRTVRSILWKEAGGLRSPREVAESVHMAPRTLRRKLLLQGTSLSSLIDQERRTRALMFLAEPNLSLAQIASRLSYGSVQNFERAFRRWTGKTPAAFRRE